MNKLFQQILEPYRPLSGGSNAGQPSNAECGEKKSGMGTDQRTNPPPAQTTFPVPVLAESLSNAVTHGTGEAREGTSISDPVAPATPDDSRGGENTLSGGARQTPESTPAGQRDDSGGVNMKPAAEWPSIAEQLEYWNNLAKPDRQFDDVADRALAEGDRTPSDGVAPVRGIPPEEQFGPGNPADYGDGSP
jgi:hypothetical protein